MPHNCTVEARNKARAAIETLAARPDVVAHDLIPPQTDPSDRWTVELRIDADGLPPAIVAELADRRLTLRHSGPRQSMWHCVAVV